MRPTWITIIGLLTCSWFPVQAEEDSLTDLSFEELMNIEVTLASRKEERLFETATAIFVITQDDIQRMGATSIPEALRLVPGMQVAHLDANKWAISARGFNGRFSQKLLVLIDGRSIYTPIFSGVFWEDHDVMLQDVDRIEVIRGPGATLWGTNAVNGIINIITQNAHNTQGGYAEAGIGTEERGFGAIRYGGNVTDQLQYRVYTKYFYRDAFVDSMGQTAADEWHQTRAGFRVDWQPTLENSVTAQGSLYRGQVGETYNIPILTPPFEDRFDEDTNLTGGHLLARWDHDFSATSGMTLQASYDRNRRTDSVISILHETYDIDFQHRFALGSRQEIVWGGGYRTSQDTTKGGFKLSFVPSSRTTNQLSAFLQNVMVLSPDKLQLTLGSKFEHNDFTGMEYQPNIRFLWTPFTHHILWGAVSRALRIPARADDDVSVAFQVFNSAEINPTTPQGSLPVSIRILGEKDLRSEKLIAYELGYRTQPSSNLSFDVSAFYNVYKDLRAARAGAPVTLETTSGITHLDLPLFIDNLKTGKSHGLEIVTDWQILAKQLRLRTAYSYLKVNINLAPNASPASRLIESGNPKHQFFMRASLDLPHNMQLDGAIRFVDHLPTEIDEITSPFVDLFPKSYIGSYTELDLHFGWQLSRAVKMSIVGQNLLQAHHLETEDVFLGTLATQTQRGIYSTFSWSF